MPTTSRSRFASASIVGEVLLGGEANVQGHSVNIAARIQALAQPGGICVTEAVHRAVRDTLGIAMRQLGPQNLKNITEPIEVFAIEVNGPPLPISAELPPAPSELIQPFIEASVAVLPVANLSRRSAQQPSLRWLHRRHYHQPEPFSRSPGDRPTFGLPVQGSRPPVFTDRWPTGGALPHDRRSATLRAASSGCGSSSPRRRPTG